MSNAVRISVFINTLNEAKRIRACLESVKWADEIVVVDMHSDDETLAIARQYTDKVFLTPRLGYCEPARKFAAEQTTGDWILNIDADELITLGLKQELLRLAGEGQWDAVYVPRRNFFWGEEMQYSGCGQFQDRQMRFYKRQAVVFSEIIHAGVQLKEGTRVYKIDNPHAHLLHFSYVTPEQYWEKLDRYTTIEAKALFASGKTYTMNNALKDAWNAFWKRYIKKGKGYKDGPWGFIYCVWTAIYKLNVYAKYMLMRAHNTADYALPIEQKYEAMIAQTLKGLSASQYENRSKS